MSKSIDYQIVYRARQLIEEKDNWCTGTYALDATGRDVPSEHHAAERFCAWGALKRAAHELGASSLRGTEIIHAITSEPLPLVNDRSDHADVVRLFDNYLATHNR